MKKFFEKVKKSDFEIVRPARKWVWFAPLAILVIALIVSSFYKFQIFNLGLDFTGGTIIKLTDSEIEDDENAYKESILDILGENGVDKNKVQLVVEKSSGETSLSVKYPSVNEKTDDEMTEINEKIIADIKDAHTSATVSNADTISASASSERIINIIIAVMVSLLCILIYMLFRFKFTNGMAAVIALIHDVIIMAACVSIFRIQINSSFIAAAITIVAYSLNNTLVLFDRVRDYEKNNDPRSIEGIVDQSVKDTLFRTTLTTITTLVPVIVLSVLSIALGATSIAEFSLPIMFGLIAGTYSTIFMTSVLYVQFEKARQISKRKKLASK